MSQFSKTNSLDLEFHSGWLTVWFNEPERRNPLTTERSAELIQLCKELQNNRDVRGVVFRGRGEVFCAGGDLSAFKDALQGSSDREATLHMSLGAGELFDAVSSLPQFVVMALEGACVAGGLGLACCGDLVIAQKDTKLSLTEVRIGLTPAQIAPFVIRRVGSRLARRLMLTGALLDGQKAYDFGLVDNLVESPAEMQKALADTKSQIQKCAPHAVATTKELLLALPRLDRPAQMQLAAESFADCLLSEEGKEGIASFAQKRKPSWAEGS